MRYEVKSTDPQGQRCEHEYDGEFKRKDYAIKYANKLKEQGHTEVLIDIFGVVTYSPFSSSEDEWINYISIN